MAAKNVITVLEFFIQSDSFEGNHSCLLCFLFFQVHFVKEMPFVTSKLAEHLLEVFKSLPKL